MAKPESELTALECDLLDLVADMFPHTAFRAVHEEARALLLEYQWGGECDCPDCEDSARRRWREEHGE